MSHLGDRLSALVDGELGHDERDRLHAHLAACAPCREEATALRALKRRVAGLGDAAMDPGLFQRLLRMAEPGEPVPRRPGAPAGPGRRPALLVYPRAARPVPPGPARRPRRLARRRTAYFVASAVSFAALAVAGLSFLAGGTQAAPGPHVTPPVQLFTVEHSVTTGEVPFGGPAATFSPAHASRHARR